MRLRAALQLAAMLAFASFLVVGTGCEKKSEKKSEKLIVNGGDGGDGGDTPPPVSKKPWPSETGSITGTVKAPANVPPMQNYDMSAKAECAHLHPQGTPKLELIVKGEGGGLRDVFVEVTKGLHEAYEVPAPSGQVTIDQKGCVYLPHVFGVRVNQDILIKNSDAFPHNVKVESGRPFNEGVNAGQPLTKKKWFKKTGKNAFKCDYHSWMQSWACVVDHPCYAVTDSNGKFEIKGVPPGKYTISFWHETAPGLKKPEDVEVEVAAGAAADIGEVSF